MFFVTGLLYVFRVFYVFSLLCKRGLAICLAEIGSSIHVTVGPGKPLARLKVVRRLSVDKGQVLWSGILDTSFSLRVLPL